jgi:hypothetical protein
MTTREWIIETPQHHLIRVEHNYWSGKAFVFVDGVVAFFRPRKLYDLGFQHQVNLDGVPYVVQVRPNHLGGFYEYECFQNATLADNPTKRTILGYAVQVGIFVLLVLLLIAGAITLVEIGIIAVLAKLMAYANGFFKARQRSQGDEVQSAQD